MTTSDLILCANLLGRDAKEYDEMASDDEDYTSIAKARAKDRRNLRDMMAQEVERRDQRAMRRDIEKYKRLHNGG